MRLPPIPIQVKAKKVFFDTHTPANTPKASILHLDALGDSHEKPHYSSCFNVFSL